MNKDIQRFVTEPVKKFTLIELLAAIAVVAVITVLVGKKS